MARFLDRLEAAGPQQREQLVSCYTSGFAPALSSFASFSTGSTAAATSSSSSLPSALSSAPALSAATAATAATATIAQALTHHHHHHHHQQQQHHHHHHLQFGPFTLASLPWKTTTVAAASESFYRSALNSKINQALTGVRGPLFPQMHVQLPTRIIYINGFKGVRVIVDKYIRPEDYPGREKAVCLLAAVTPGLVMTPVSSVLEACNASLNPQPLYRRWLNGYTARTGREVIFGVGLNQLSEHFERRTPEHMSPVARNALGCVTAGVIAAYLSHVPHNLSTMKLMNPRQSYVALFQQFSRTWYARLEVMGASKARDAAAMLMSVALPQGLFTRTVQVVGSFIILNGIIHGLKGPFGEDDAE